MTTLYKSALNRLEDFYSMEDNWNNEGSPAPSPESVSRAKALLELYEEYAVQHNMDNVKFYMYPLVDGGVQLAIDHYEKSVEIHIENENKNNVIVWRINQGEPEIESKEIEFKKYRDASFASDVHWLRDLP